MSKHYPKTINLVVGELFERLPRDVRFLVTKGLLPVYGRTIESVVGYDDRIEVMLGEVAIEYTIAKVAHKLTDSALVVLKGDIHKVTIGVQEDDEFSQLWLTED